jgi:putative tryptophan/tyrosine transport system substrate-binding protein
MRRRVFITGAASLVAMQATGVAQTARANRKIGYLHPLSNSVSPPPVSLSSMRPIWQKLGYVEGETVLLRGAEGDPSRLRKLASELISLDVAVLIAIGPAALRAASQETKTTPIVAVDLETDPVRSGLAATFGRPGGNVTGLFLDQPGLAGRWLELLREAAPWIERIALVWEPTSGTDQLDAAKVAARTIGIEALVVEVRTTEGYEDAFRNLGGERRMGIVQLGSPALTMPADRLGDAALKYRLPTISFYTPHARGGALFSYGPNLEVYFPRAATLADKIINGASPGELPIEQPDHFQLIINLKTAKALGLALPPSLLARADEIIE